MVRQVHATSQLECRPISEPAICRTHAHAEYFYELTSSVLLCIGNIAPCSLQVTTTTTTTTTTMNKRKQQYQKY
eukprot:667929-Amphidinium_carterae.1